MIHCCNGCADRAMGCHGGCERYASEKAAHNALMEHRRAVLTAENDVTEYNVSMARKRRH